MEFKDSQTYKNLQKAYDGERMASTKYRIYADKAREDGYVDIGNTFDEAAGNEKEHGEVFLKKLNDGKVPDTLENLEEAYAGEVEEWTTLYPEFAKVAEAEGYPEIAKLFEAVGKIERHHDFHFEKLAEEIPDNGVFCKGTKTVWICMNCGNLYYGDCAPEKCLVCGYPQGYFKENQ